MLRLSATLREATRGVGEAAGPARLGRLGRAVHAARRAGRARVRSRARLRARARAAHERRDRPRHGENRLAGPRLMTPAAPARPVPRRQSTSIATSIYSLATTPTYIISAFILFV